MERKRLADSLKRDVERFNLIGFEVSEAKEKDHELDSIVNDLMRKIAELEDLGVIVRDINMGLIDFPAERFGERVFLCWKYGEPNLEYWHSINEGFNGRKLLRVQVISP
jgi:hypothetical protein